MCRPSSTDPTNFTGSRVLAALIALCSRRLQTGMRSSRLPAIRTLADFDFSFQPLRRAGADRLAARTRLRGAQENIVFLGPPGVGKMHVAISLAIATAEAGARSTTAP